MTTEDWNDPFAEDEAARERERRRAERAARRRGQRAERTQRQGALAERVKGVMARSGGDGDGGPLADPRLAAAPAARSEAPPPRPPAGNRAALGAHQPPPPPPSGSPETARRRRLIVAAAVVVVVVGIVAGAAAAIHHFTAGNSSPPPPKQAEGAAREITIPEGYDRHQIADLAKQDGIKGDYVKASESFKGFNPAKYGAQNPSSLEGFLFPATYDLPRHPTVDDLIARQLDAFAQYMGQVNMKYAKSKNLTPYDVLIIGSMIEREAVVEKDRPLIAAVIYNRLSQGIPLGIDATIRFAENNWTRPLTESDLKLDSPYNTRTNAGLTPTPIGNPGLASLKAAAHPANVGYLYYVLKPDGCTHFFTANYQEFLQASDKYEAARQAAGGKAPTDCS
jgi:cell division protein YceG involved in septum cleavage